MVEIIQKFYSVNQILVEIYNYYKTSLSVSCLFACWSICYTISFTLGWFETRYHVFKITTVKLHHKQKKNFSYDHISTFVIHVISLKATLYKKTHYFMRCDYFFKSYCLKKSIYEETLHWSAAILQKRLKRF